MLGLLHSFARILTHSTVGRRFRTGPAPREGRTSNLAWICLSALRNMSYGNLPDLQLALPSEATATDAFALLRDRKSVV